MEDSTQLLAPIRTSRTTPLTASSASASISDESVAIRNMPRAAAPARRFLVRPIVDPETTLDLPDAVADAIARELGRAFGGNAVLNRLEAGAHLASLLAAATRRLDDERTESAPGGRRRAPQSVPLGLALHIDGGQPAG